MKINFRLLNFFILLCFFIFGDSKRTSQVIALQKIYDSLDGRNWINCKWDIEKNIENYCNFCGLECNEQSMITSITLPNNGLKGEIPGEIDLLQKLKILEMNNNNM